MKNITIYDWMISKCGLSGNELILFAYLYDGYLNRSTLSLPCILVRLKSLMSKATIYRCLDSLERKKLIVKHSSSYCSSYSYSSSIVNALEESDKNLKELIRIARIPWVKK